VNLKTLMYLITRVRIMIHRNSEHCCHFVKACNILYLKVARCLPVLLVKQLIVG
jgi:hypothetical protein